ncbi:MAG: hypothetical protein JO040_14185, partial [Gemmatimonadetes bacterium]|nr:hypothetical protein [Gemmatimonadota bacterium]
GQGPVDVTPIGVARFIQAIGNDGVMVQPTVEWDRAGQAPEGKRIMSPQVARKLQGAMLAVVDSGTAKTAQPLMEGTGWDMAGKTGTAQVPGRHDDGWFAGLMYGPDGKPHYTITVYLRGGGPGGHAPAAVAGGMTRIMSRLNIATGRE